MGCKEIDWSTLPAAYGPATRVPGLLQELASPIPGVRSDAIDELWGCLCHQGTVYEASAVAAPFLYRAAKAAHLQSAERSQLLALLVHIGLGEDTTWRGYAPWSVVEDCAVAVEALLPDMASWALEGDREARAWTLALAAYHPGAWKALGIDAALLMPGTDVATADLVSAALSGTTPAEGLVPSVLALNDDLRDYYEEVVSTRPADRQARQLVLELAATECL